MNGRIDWMEMICNALNNYPGAVIWVKDGSIFTDTEMAAYSIQRLIEVLYKNQGEDVMIDVSHCDGDTEDELDTGSWRITFL